MAFHKPSTYLTHRANDGIKIDYPSDWQIEEREGSIYLTTPSHDDQDTILESLDISVAPTYQQTPGDFATFLIDDWYIKNLAGFRLIEEKPTSVNGRPTYIIVYNYTDENIGNALAMDIIIEHLDNFYLLTYTAEPSNYYNYLPIIKTIVNSFDIEDSTGGIGKDSTGGIGEDSTGGIGEDSTGGIGEDSTGGIGEDSTGGIVQKQPHE
jgi:hypothetical protein